MQQNNKIEGPQYLRYMKTFIWAIKKTKGAVTDVLTKGEIHDYPVDAKTLEDAINYIETGDGLRTTKISKTDLYAIMEAMQHIKDE